MNEPNPQNKPPQPHEHSEQQEKKQSTPQLILSILAGAIGVQSNKNRERDFQAGSFKKFVIGGLIFTALFIIILLTIVNFVIAN